MRIYRSEWERRFGKSESPIEAMFLDAFCKLAVDHGYDVAKASKATAWVIRIEPQKWFEQYRVDFLISYPFFGKDLLIVVECDGHQWHEKTKAQAKKDKSRDRALQSIGAKVFRFTGSEINGNPGTCAGEVLDVIETFQTDSVLDAFETAERTAVA